jgi:nitrate reductase gamma subunit
MVDVLIDFARGPLLRASLLVMALGLLRVALLQAVELGFAWSRAGDQVVAWSVVIKRGLRWLWPWRAVRDRDRAPYTGASVLFHIGVLLVPIFLAGHTAIWHRELGVPLPSLPAGVADTLTALTLVSLLWLLASRMTNRARRQLSRAQDWWLPILLLLCFAAGWLVAHPRFSPMDARLVYLVHLLLAETILVLVPLSKLQHLVLFWTSPVSTELGWRFPPGTGDRVRASLGKQGQGV